MRTDRKTVGVIGAGIVGMSSALHLQKAGFDIKVIDWRAPGTATSFGNAGAIVTSAIEPTSTPKVLQNIPRYLLDPELLRPTGWLKLFRTERGFTDTLLQRQLMEVHGIAYDVLGPEEIHQLEPSLARMFARGLFHGDSASISSPHRLIEGYAKAFVHSGGEFFHERVLRIEPLEPAE
jgi:D-amino-acid dehydrogenase